MKRLKTFKIAVTSLVVAFVLTTSCNKTTENPVVKSGDEDYTELIEKSKAMQEHVEAFKEKMEYYRDNPGVKSGGTLYTADSGALELETLLNYDFCFTDIEVSQKTFVTSEVIMPLDDIQRINDPKLMEVYYEKVIDTIKAQMIRINYSNMKLLLVDIDVVDYDSNGDAVISIGAMIGSAYTFPSTEEVGWWFGNLHGDCEGNNPGVDASIIINNDVMFAMFPAPPPGKIRKMTNIKTLTDDHIKPSDHWRKIPAYRNNFKDSKVFTANYIYGDIEDDQRCLANYPEYDPINEDCANEMSFYTYKYDEIINLKEGEYNSNNGTDYEIVNFVVFNYEEFLPFSNEHEKIWHEIEVSLGYIWLIDDTWVTIDIQNYNTN